MNRSELSSHVATRAHVSKTEADRVIGAVFTAIEDALARGETVAGAGFGKVSAPHRRPARAAPPAPGSAWPAPPSRCRHARRERRFATRSTRSARAPSAEIGLGAAPSDTAAVTAACPRADHGPARIRATCCTCIARGRRHRCPCRRHADLHGGSRCASAPAPRAISTCGAGRRREEFFDSSPVRTPAQSRAENDTPRAGVL